MALLDLHTTIGARLPGFGLFRAIRQGTRARNQRIAHAKALRQLSTEQLADIGITRAEADAEANRLVWNPPIQMRG